MRMLTLPFAAALIFVRDLVTPAPPAPASVPPPEAAAPEAEEAAAPVLAPAAPVAALRETNAPVPAGVAVKIRGTAATGWKAELTRRGYLVALRRGADRAAGEDGATLAVTPGGDDPVVWETTKLDTLETTRGTLRVEGDAHPMARLRLADPPAAAARDDQKHHTCVSHEDGEGGFTVLCRVLGNATAASVTGDDPKAGIWVVGSGSRVVRMDLPAPNGGAEARIVGYASGVDGVVIRAEATRAEGEDRPSLAILSSERAQPQVPRRFIRYECVF